MIIIIIIIIIKIIIHVMIIDWVKFNEPFLLTYKLVSDYLICCQLF